MKHGNFYFNSIDMKYFLDCEFLEGTQEINGKSKPTIDLISIGIVSEDGREYYAVSNSFYLFEAFNRNQVNSNNLKEYWIRDNVIKPIWNDFVKLAKKQRLKKSNFKEFRFGTFQYLRDKYGKPNNQIASEILDFIYPKVIGEDATDYYLEKFSSLYKPEFYGYCCDYDWVVFCWLWGRMIDLPKGFPMYCIDLKQTLDEKVYWLPINNREFTNKWIREQSTFEERLKDIKNHPDYPKQENEHNALADARWNKKLHEFLQTL